MTLSFPFSIRNLYGGKSVQPHAQCELTRAMVGSLFDKLKGKSAGLVLLALRACLQAQLWRTKTPSPIGGKALRYGDSDSLH
jgi:hypothetical protein